MLKTSTIDIVAAALAVIVLVMIGTSDWEVPKYVKRYYHSEEALKQNWATLCAHTDCSRFPVGHATIHLTNGDVIYKHDSWSECARDEGQCFSTVSGGGQYYDRETQRSVAYDVLGFGLVGRDVSAMLGHRWSIMSQASPVWFGTTGVSVYGARSSTDLAPKDTWKLSRNSLLRSTYFGQSGDAWRNTTKLPSVQDVTIPSADDRFLKLKDPYNPRAFFVIYRKMVFGHHIIVRCNSSHDCNLMSYDFDENTDPLGLQIEGFPVDELMPDANTVSMYDQIAASLNMLEDLYAFLKTHPDDRPSREALDRSRGRER